MTSDEVDGRIDELSAALAKDGEEFARGDDCDLEGGRSIDDLTDTEILEGALDREASGAGDEERV